MALHPPDKVCPVRGILLVPGRALENGRQDRVQLMAEGSPNPHESNIPGLVWREKKSGARGHLQENIPSMEVGNS
ncbi:hypothetical protein [Neomoorella thermoacetica]|uniref:hypothetical protein n=1 Tax=Neomoorella thermoacetica TaxID=1525 RepID=UPI0008FBBD76|nr:hypothetical protein [Moorella thermoacetica]APC08399.1 hypothetical protein MTJW_12380 [Moorella thermoacetica]